MTLSRTVYPNEIIVGAPGEDLESSDQDEAGSMYSHEIFNRRYVPLYGFGQSFVAKDNDGGDQFGSAMAVCHFPAVATSASQWRRISSVAAIQLHVQDSRDMGLELRERVSTVRDGRNCGFLRGNRSGRLG